MTPGKLAAHVRAALDAAENYGNKGVWLDETTILRTGNVIEATAWSGQRFRITVEQVPLS